jgi:hypothetical protein
MRTSKPKAKSKHPTSSISLEDWKAFYDIAGDERLYHGLALIDAIRVGRARERKLAGEHLMRMLAA